MKQDTRDMQSHTVNGPADLADAMIDTMVRMPMRVTGDLMVKGVQGMQRLAGVEPEELADSTNHSETVGGAMEVRSAPSTSPLSSVAPDQDLSGNDLKYVAWSLVFTKPGYESVLQPRQDELLNYSADANTYAVLKIAQFLNGTRDGHSKKPESWAEKGYPHVAAPAGQNDRPIAGDISPRPLHKPQVSGFEGVTCLAFFGPAEA